MGLFRQLFQMQEENSIDYKEQLTEIMNEEELIDTWFKEIVLEKLEAVEAQIERNRMPGLLAYWTNIGECPEDFEDVSFLHGVNQEQGEWIKEVAQLHYEVRSPEGTNMEVYLNNLGEPYASLPSFDLKRTYFAIKCEFLNIISQVPWNK